MLASALSFMCYQSLWSRVVLILTFAIYLKTVVAPWCSRLPMKVLNCQCTRFHVTSKAHRFVDDKVLESVSEVLLYMYMLIQGKK
jgi:hypothetical protein